MARLNKDIINNFPTLVRKPLRDKEFSVIMDELLETTSFIYESSLKKALKKEEVLYEENFTAENGQRITLYCSTPRLFQGQTLSIDFSFNIIFLETDRGQTSK